MTYWQKLKSLFSLKDLLFTVLLFGIIITMAFCKAETLIDVSFGDAAVDVVSPSFTMNIPYDMVESIELAKIDENDELVNGTADIAIRTGIWSNSSWGEYSACVDVQGENCILVHLDDGRLFVISGCGDKETDEVFAQFQSHLNEK